MAKISTSVQRKLLIPVLCFFLMPFSIVMAAYHEPPNLTVTASLEHAKVLLMQGHRREALAELDQLALSIHLKKERKQISLKRRLFMEQFLTSDDFQAYQEAKEFAEMEHWSDSLQRINLIKTGDQDNLMVLELKTLCQRNLNQADEAEKTLKMLLSMDPTYCSTPWNNCRRLKVPAVKNVVVKVIGVTNTESH